MYRVQNLYNTVVSAVRVLTRDILRPVQLSSSTILLNHFSSKSKEECVWITPVADFNSALKDYALKQELKKDFTHYKEEADRREMFREVYLNLSKEGNKAMYICIINMMDRSEKVMNDKHCLLCNIPQNLISYLVFYFYLIIYLFIECWFVTSVYSRIWLNVQSSCYVIVFSSFYYY